MSATSRWRQPRSPAGVQGATGMRLQKELGWFAGCGGRYKGRASGQHDTPAPVAE